MEETWIAQLVESRTKLERVKSGLIKSRIAEPIISDLLQNLIDMVGHRIEEITKSFDMVKCSDCNYVTQSEQALSIHKKMVHY